MEYKNGMKKRKRLARSFSRCWTAAKIQDQPASYFGTWHEEGNLKIIHLITISVSYGVDAQCWA